MTVHNFINSPTITSIQVKDRSRDMVKFPDVIVCPWLFVNPAKVRSLGLDMAVFRQLIAQTRPVVTLPDNSQLSDVGEEFLKRNNMTLGELLILVGPRCEEHLQWAEYNRQVLNISSVCADARLTFDMGGDLCWVFSVLDRPAWTGSDGSLKLGFKLLKTLTSPIEDDYELSVYGLKVSVHKEFHPTKDEYVSVGGGSVGVLSISENAASLKNPFPWSRCCIDTPHHCGCKPLWDDARAKELWPDLYNHSTNVRNCLPSDIDCIKRADEMSDIESFCDPLPSCNSWSYTVSVSEIKYIRNPQHTGNLSTALQDYTEIRVQFSKFQVFQTHDVNSMSATDLIGSIGGVQGVFLGASVITGLEIVIFLVQKCAV